ncbi:MAG: hypothetical protein ABIO06_04700, partial [Pseudolysinimonas sp.]
QALAKGKSAIEAMTAAGYRTDRGNASRLTANDNIRQRVSELQDKGAKKVEVTIGSLSAELELARAGAMGEKQFSAAVSASLGKAKLFGLIIDKTRHSGTVQIVTLTTQDLDKLTDNELAALEAAYPVLEKLGLVGGAGGPAPETTH